MRGRFDRRRACRGTCLAPRCGARALRLSAVEARTPLVPYTAAAQLHIAASGAPLHARADAGGEHREVLGPWPADAGAQTIGAARAPKLGGRECELAAGAAELRKGAKGPTRRRRGWNVARGRTSTGPSERLTSIGAVEASTIRQRRPAVPGVAPYIWKLDTLCPKAANSLSNRPANTPTWFTTKVPQKSRGQVYIPFFDVRPP